MPNYRNKNKNRKNKNRNKNNNQNKDQQHNQNSQQNQNSNQNQNKNQQQQQEQQEQLNVQHIDDEATVGLLHENVKNSGNISKPAAANNNSHSNDCNLLGNAAVASTSISATHNESDTSNDALITAQNPIVVQQTNNNNSSNNNNNNNSETTKNTDCIITTIVPNNDTVLQETVATQHSDLLSTTATTTPTQATTQNMGVHSTKMLKINEIDSDKDLYTANSNNNNNTVEEAPKHTTKPAQAKVIIHRIVQEPNVQAVTAPVTSTAQQKAKVIIHRITLEEDAEVAQAQLSPQNYTVESPKTVECSEVQKYSNKDLQILELSDTGSMSDTNDNQLLSPLISEVESETETTTTNANNTNAQILSIQTLPLYADEPSTESAPNATAQQDDVKQRRAQKRAALENHFLPQMLSPRYLDSIVEENSDMSDSRSDCSDRAMLQHNVHADDTKAKKANAVFPKSNLDFSRKHKHGTLPKISLTPGAIREETVAIVVETKLIDQANAAEECCARLSSTLAPASEAAELVYINSASSSTSDLMDLDLEDSTLKPAILNIDLDTDAKEIISKPLEVIAEAADSRESTPVNQISTPAPTPTAAALTTSNNNANDNNNSDCLFKTIHTTTNETLNYDNVEEQYKFIEELVRTASEELSSGSISSDTMHRLSDSERSEDVQSFDTYINSSDTDTEIPSSSSSQSLPNSNNSSRLRAEPSLPLSQSNVLQLRNSEMNNVREFLNNQKSNAEFQNLSFSNENASSNNIGTSLDMSVASANGTSDVITSRKQLTNAFFENPIEKVVARAETPPPIPPPPSVLYNDNTASALHDCLTTTTTTTPATTATHTHVIPIQTLANTKPSISVLSRQESADSHYSDSTNNSQCTAINVGTSNSQSDFELPTSPISDTTTETEYYNNPATTTASNESAIKKLRFLCAETLASMPYGEEVLEELAAVAQNIGEVNAANKTQKMPYPLPDLPHINDLQLAVNQQSTSAARTVAIQQLPAQQQQRLRTPTPPPLPAAASDDKAWLGLPTDKNPNLLVCLSPSQRNYISAQQTKTSEIQNPDELLDAHQKFIDRRGYHEMSREQVKSINSEKMVEQQILETAATMKKLRKSLTPTPPPVPPPPVPVKSSDTAAKAQSQKKIANEYALGQRHDASLTSTHKDANKQTTTTPVAAPAPFTNNLEDRNLVKDGEENKHRLLAIIHDTNDIKQSDTKPKTSSFENNSRQPTKSTAHKQGEPLQPAQQKQAVEQSHTQNYQTFSSAVSEHREHITNTSATSTADMFPTKQSATTAVFPSAANQMPSMESEFSKMFPNLAQSNIFDAEQKRFSNIETYSKSPFCGQLMSTQPKRFSNIETSSYESKKRIENGQVVYDYTNSNREFHTDGDPSAKLSELKQDTAASQKIDAAQNTSFAATAAATSNEENKNKIKNQYQNQNQNQSENQTTKTRNIEIMSELKLNTKAADTFDSAAAQPTIAERERIDILKNRQQNESTSNNNNSNISSSNSHSTYDEFRQRAKAAAAATTTKPATPFSAPATSNGGHEKLFDHENLFKDFDDLSKQLHMELETGKAQRVQREKSASLYDLNRMHMHTPFGKRLDNWKQERHEHMKELEREIEKSMKARQMRFHTQQQQQQTEYNPFGTQPRTYDIPIRLEQDSNTPHAFNRPTQIDTPSSISTPRTPHSGDQRIYDIPIQLESPITPGQQSYDYTDNARFRRAESMFNLTDNMQAANRQRAGSINYSTDDWSRYASDLGSSENIARPFAREVEICYERAKPRTIRAPRLSVSTNDLSNNTQCYDNYNAYNVRRTHAPMLNQAPQKSRPQYLSCSSMIERNPNPTYISTTSRRGVSPAPNSAATTQPEQHYHVPEAELRQRRASLPREIQEQQLKYIQSKEDELKTEFERLQSERRRLMDEMQRAPTLQMPQRPARDFYRPAPKLPTLSEDEVFRQQMAEEWLNKVAEREERRLQKIIKISKINEEAGTHQIPIQLTSSKPDISQEFLNRVKERRSKLDMPADSDWESGAESQPLATKQASEEEVPTVKVLEGKSEASLNQLPRHLREFAKFSNHQKELIDGGEREIHQEEERRQEADNNSMSSAMKKSSIVKTIKISRQPTANSVIAGSGAAVRNIPIGQEYFDERELLSTTPISVPIPIPSPTTSTTTTTTTTPTPNMLSAIPKSPIFTKLPVSFGDMFATSPFKSRIYEEFNNYWRSFDKN